MTPATYTGTLLVLKCICYVSSWQQELNVLVYLRRYSSIDCWAAQMSHHLSLNGVCPGARWLHLVHDLPLESVLSLICLSMLL